MATRPKLVILGIDENKASQSPVLAKAFKDAGILYRYIVDSRKVPGALKQLKPGMVLVFAEVHSEAMQRVAKAVAEDASFQSCPIVAVCTDSASTPLVVGLRRSVVALLQAPFEKDSVSAIQKLWNELPGRAGSISGAGAGKHLGQLFTHITSLHRTGVLVTHPHTKREGKATFTAGTLQAAHFLQEKGEAALREMQRQAQVKWVFSEVEDADDDGALDSQALSTEDVSTEDVSTEDVSTEDVSSEGIVIEVDDILAEAEEAPSEPTLELSMPVSQEAAAVEADAPQRLLLADDDEAILGMLLKLFMKRGFQVTTVSDGQKGVEAALKQEFDIVLTDLNMPNLDGWGMLRALREDFRTRELPIAVLSAHDDYRESLRALNSGAQAYLSKGVKLDAIIAETEKLLDRRKKVKTQLKQGKPFTLSIHQAGPQWLLRQCVQAQRGGSLVARDGWASYQLFFADDGNCIHALATAGKYTAHGEKAFNAFVASKAAEGDFLPSPSPQVSPNIQLSTEEMLRQAVETLNENELRMRESLMLGAKALEVNQELYVVYQQVGPKPWLEVARLICEEKLPPRDVIAHTDISPVEVEETMKDLVRRGVVTLMRN